ncbi:MAG TPA: TonB-dependent receptor [Thermoanaerobaculia bacterium]|jgi:outer membrane receptor protein involved in Fe transport
MPRVIWIVPFLLLLLLAAVAGAQTTDTASLRGSVVDPSGAAVSGARVTLENADTGLRRETTSDSRGEFRFGTLPVTDGYKLTVAMSGFTDTTEGPFTLRAGETASFHTRLGAQAASGTVTVFGTSEHVRTDSPELGTRLEENAIRELPVIGRKLTNLPLFNSAVRPARGTGDLFLNNTLFVINGGGRRQTTYTLDGSNADDAWGRQTIFTNVPLSSVQELTVLTNAFSAEYGRSTGSAINVVTHAGTNEMMGDFSVLYRPRSLQPDAPVTGLAAGDELRQGSATISGPIVADRVHFLVSAEYNDQQRESSVTSLLAPSVFDGTYRQTLGMARVDADINDANHFFARGNIDRFTDTNPADAVGGNNLPSAARTFRRSTRSLQLSESMVIGGNAFNEARIIGQWGDPITEFEPVTPSPQFIRPGVSTEGESRSARLTNDQYQLADTFSWTSGRHSLRIGGDYLRSTSGGNGQEFGSPFVLGQFTFRTGIPASTPTSQLTIADVTRFTQGFGNVTYEVTDELYSAFVQDDWRPLDRLTLNLGLRYDRQKLTGDDDNLAPRLGFAYTLNDRTALRGGYGIYYSQIRSNIVAGWELNGPEGFFTYSVAPGQLGFPTSLTPPASLPTGANVPARDITVRPGRADYYNQFFDVSRLRFYPDELVNPRTWQTSLGFERALGASWFLSTDFVYAHTTDIERNIDANAPAEFVRTAQGQTRNAAAADATRPIVPVANGYRRILVTVNQGEVKHRSAQINLRRTFEERYGVLASYTWSHTRNNVEPDAPGGDPNDPNRLDLEWADSLLDQRHRGVVTVWRRVPLGIVIGGVATAASGRPYNITIGTDVNSDAANSDRPIVNGSVLGRNAGRNSSVMSFDAFAEKEFAVGGARLGLRAEVFNLTNRENVVGRNGVYGNAADPLAALGTPLGGIANVEPGRQVQFALRVQY